MQSGWVYDAEPAPSLRPATQDPLNSAGWLGACVDERRDRAFQVLLKLGTRFGLDPSSRADLVVANQTSPDFAEEFLFKPL